LHKPYAESVPGVRLGRFRRLQVFMQAAKTPMVTLAVRQQRHRTPPATVTWLSSRPLAELSRIGGPLGNMHASL